MRLWPSNRHRENLGTPVYKLESPTKQTADDVREAIKKAREVVHQKPGYHDHLVGPDPVFGTLTDPFPAVYDTSYEVPWIEESRSRRFWNWIKKGFQNE